MQAGANPAHRTPVSAMHSRAAGRVLDDVTAAGMEQPVVGPLVAAAEIALRRRGARANHAGAQVPKETGARGSAADDEGVDGQGSRHRERG